MEVRELAPGIYERVDTPRDVKITMEEAKRLGCAHQLTVHWLTCW